ncbi:MAG: hypothetical protein K0R49_470 [Burkholderiales bacterium]|jgi:drug/metabolite transporter (DMT)-like permease|nr:hypothetical protein [Burkholderiales bacterium]
MLSGYFDAAIYVTLTAISFVFLNRLMGQINPVVALFAMSFFAIVNFNLMSLKQLKATYIACFNNKLLYLIMSGSLALDWICMLYSSYITDPFVSMSALFIFLAVIGVIQVFAKNKSIASFVSIIMLIMSVFILYFGYMVNASEKLGLGIILGGVAGSAFYIYIVSSKELVKRSNLSTLQVLATRFWILFIGAAYFLPYHNLLAIIANNIVSLVIISYASLIVPIYFNQQAIKKLGSTVTALCISYVPPVTYLFYVIYNHNLIWSNVVVCIIITSALILAQGKRS